MPSSFGEGALTSSQLSWANKISGRLYQLQKMRFNHVSPSRAQEQSIAIRIANTERKQIYADAIARHVLTLPDKKAVNKFYSLLREIKDEEELALVIAADTQRPHRDPAQFRENYIKINDIGGTDEDQIDNIVSWYTLAQREGKVLSARQIVREASRYALGLGGLYSLNAMEVSIPYDPLMVAKQSIGGLCGPIPLKHVQEIEVARSGKILKFRATGSVFLANQEGGEDAIRIEGFLYRGEVLLLMGLYVMFMVGQGRVKEIENIDMSNPTISLAQMRSRIQDVISFNKRTERPTYEFHKTFPFVSRHIIVPNTYIETFSFEERLVDGKDAIKYSLLLRTYRKPSGFDFYTTQSSDYGFIMPKGNKFLSTYRVVEYGINFIVRLVQSLNITLGEQEWKIKHDTAGNNEVSYDLDGYDIAATTLMGLVGMA
ncbi:MAG: hypothetical protein V3V14_08360 [Saprospiraceae bacterium]